jgi:hypothetical protein
MRSCIPHDSAAVRRPASRYGLGPDVEPPLRLTAGVSQHRPACHDGSETGRAMRGKGIEIAFAALAVVSAAALIASVAVFVLH